jgi:cell division protease FtsH
MADFKPNNKTSKKPTFKFSIFWMYALILLFLVGMYVLNKEGNTIDKDVTLQEFTKYATVDHGVTNIIISDDNTVVGVLTDSLAAKIFDKQYTQNKNNITAARIHTDCNYVSMTDMVTQWSKEGIYTGKYETEQESSLSKILWSIGPLLLLVVFWIFIMRRMGGGGAGGGAGIFNVGKSKAQIFDKNNSVKVNFNDVAGLAEAKTEIEEIVEFLKNPQRYTELGGKIPKGALLVGPPGTGKTLLAKAVAGEANVPFFYMSGSEFTEMFVGVGASRVRDLFRQAKEKSPCIVFIDEIDTVGRARGKSPSMGGNDERENTLNQLLTEMDGFGTNSGVIILAATNRADILDKALMRAGRFDRQIYVELPDLNDRVAIFNVHLRNIKIDDSVDVDLLARQTPGFSGADIANVCNEAALIAARHNKTKVERQDFIDAVDRIIGGLEKRNKITTDDEKRAIAIHEAGHATVSWHLKYANPLIKVTIVPRGKALGAAWYLPEERQITPSQAILDDICSLLAGRAAEELFLGHISTGAANDLERVTKQAYAMVVYYGMSEKLPNISYYDSTGQEYGFSKPFSDDRAKMIDEEVSRIINEQYERAKAILTQYAEGHEQLANILITREVIFTEDVEQIFGKRQWSSRSDEILAAKSAEAAKAEAEEIAENKKVAEERNASNNNNDDRSQGEENAYPANMPPLPQDKKS